MVDFEVIDAVKDGSIEVVPNIASFDGATVALSDGTRIEPDAVICATGYLHGLEPLVGHLGVLDATASRGPPTRFPPPPVCASSDSCPARR